MPSAPLPPADPNLALAVTAGSPRRPSEGRALRFLLRVPLLGPRVSPSVLQGTRAQRRPQLDVDGGDVKVDELCGRQREAAEGRRQGRQVGRWFGGR